MTLLEIALITQFTLLTAGICSFIEDRRVRHRRRERLSLSKHLFVGSAVGVGWMILNQSLAHLIMADYVAALLATFSGLLNGFVAGFLSRSSLALIERHK